MPGKFGEFLVSLKFNNYHYHKKITNRHFCVMALKKIIPAHLVVKIEPLKNQIYILDS